MTLSKKHELLIFPEQNCPCVMILLQCDNVRGESWTRSGGSLTSTDGGRAFSPVLSGCTVQSLGCTDCTMSHSPGQCNLIGRLYQQ